MIKANELRIGNYLYDTINEKIVRVDITILQLVMHGAVFYQPIQITTEILAKCMFVKIVKDSHYDYYYIQNGNFTFDSQEKDSVVYVKYNEIVIGYCETLHQLQNLYFSLTIHELFVNL